MYIKFGLRVLYTSWRSLLKMSENVKQETGKNRFLIAMDAIWSMFYYGTIFTEYQAFSFYDRTATNRRTFLTVGEHLRILKQYNSPVEGGKFHDKAIFNDLFSKYLGRAWINAKIASEEDTINFLKTYEPVVMKNPGGCSGKQVYISNSQDDIYFMLDKISNGFYLVEECLTNIEEIRRLNPTSLNTLRVVTVRSGDYFKVVCACLRIGAIGAKVDNVSMGGTSARIDITNGRINSLFCANNYRKIEGSQIGRDEKGMVIPFWKETVEVLKEASCVLPGVPIVGWDVAITPKGPAIIEGNESFHTGVMQFYASTTEPGIRQLFKDTVRNIKI